MLHDNQFGVWHLVGREEHDEAVLRLGINIRLPPEAGLSNHILINLKLNHIPYHCNNLSDNYNGSTFLRSIIRSAFSPYNSYKVLNYVHKLLNSVLHFRHSYELQCYHQQLYVYMLILDFHPSFIKDPYTNLNWCCEQLNSLRPIWQEEQKRHGKAKEHREENWTLTFR